MSLLKLFVIASLQPCNMLLAIIISGGYPSVPREHQIKNQISMMGIGFITGYSVGLTGAIVNSCAAGYWHYGQMKFKE